MRCGKAVKSRPTFAAPLVATRTNALWQRFTAKDGLNACRVATRTNALWQSCLQTSLQDTHKSQPARMRCGKELGNRQGAVHCAVATRANALWQSGLSCSSCLQAAVATRANALWQRSSHAWMLTTTAGRNPRECAVAKAAAFGRIADNIVATRANTLWQRPCFDG